MSSERSRTVPQTDTCGVTPLPHAWGSADADGLQECIRCGATNFPKPTPRALVAISEDRQWLAVLDAKDEETCDGPQRFWTVFELDIDGYFPEDQLCDIGQSAEDVLRLFLSERGG